MMPKTILAENIDYQEIIESLRSGGIIVYPTDTAYALGCDATNKEAIGKIFKIKGRQENKTLPVIIGSLDMAKKWVCFSEQEEELASRHWPGPLTLLLEPVENSLPDVVVKEGRAALRVPDNKIAQELSLRLAAPLVSTSANLAGSGNFYKINDVVQSLGPNLELVDYVIDAGQLPERGVSTIARFDRDRMEVIRPGTVELLINK